MATNAKKLTYWQQHFKRCQASGLTRRAYCAREGLALSTFDRWRSLSRSTGGMPSKAALSLVQVQVERPHHATLMGDADNGKRTTRNLDGCRPVQLAEAKLSLQGDYVRLTAK